MVCHLVDVPLWRSADSAVAVVGSGVPGGHSRAPGSARTAWGRTVCGTPRCRHLYCRNALGDGMPRAATCAARLSVTTVTTFVGVPARCPTCSPDGWLSCVRRTRRARAPLGFLRT